jgi:ribonuclease D
MNLITSSSQLSKICQSLRAKDYVAVDTEFMRDKTYWSKLCLVQLASDGIEAVVDPLANIDLEPLWELARDQSVVKVFHAGRQDVEIFYNLAKTIPLPLFDTQIAAMVCGFGDSVSYDNLVRKLTGEQIDKSSRFTDWARRPLSDQQLAYGLADVTHLRVVYKHLIQELESSKRHSWLEEELAILTSTSTYTMSPEKAFERVKSKPKSKRAMAILMEISAWREQEAQRLNVPRNRVLKDDALVEISSFNPQKPADLETMRAVPRGFNHSKSAAGLLQAVERGQHRQISSVPIQVKHEALPDSLTPIVDLLRVVVKMQSKRHKVAQKLIASSDDLEQIARSDDANVAALIGWRRDLFGKMALDIKHGRLALTVRGNQVIPIEATQLDSASKEDD